MKITDLIKFLWNGVDIPITRDEIQHSVNVAVWSLKKEISEDEQFRELDNQYKISCYDNNYKKLEHIN